MTLRRFAFVLLLLPGLPRLAAATSTDIILNADARAAAASPLRHFWSAVVNGGDASQALRATWLDQWRVAAAECGFRSVRLAGIFAPELFVYREENGRPVYNFQYLDDVFDRILAASSHPFLQLDLPASAVAAGRTAELLTRFAQHYEDRYGAPELRSWSFELGPASYRAAAAALKAVDPALRVGGPAAVLDAARAGPSPVDFVSAQYFPPAAGAPSATADELRRLRARVAGSGFARAELEVSEWNSSASARDFTHDSLPAAAWILKNNLESLDLTDALAYRAFTDLAADEGAGTGIFHGGCGLITYQGVVKPAFHAYRYLNALGDELLQAAPGGVVSRRKNSGRVVVLAYNCPPEQTAGLPTSATLAAADELSHRGSPRALSINLSGLRPGGQILIEMLQFDHGNATEAWERMGAPAEPSRPAIAALQSGAREMRIEYRQADELGRFALSRPLEPWAVLLLREL